MIPAIKEIGFPSYATLHQATVTFEEMGERTISTQVRIDGDITPNFEGWALEFRGERFVLPTLKPQASKDNSTRNSLVDLVFSSSPIFELKRYFFAEMTQIENGTVMIDKYVASLRLNLTNFVAAFNKVLEYYFPNGAFVMVLDQSYQDPGDVIDFPIDYMYIWDVLQKIHEIYGVTWKMTTAEVNNVLVTTITVGGDMGSIPETDHVFQYGFEGGLLRFERHVEDTDIYNVLLGRGGEKNIPYRYFKGTDPYNTIWAADPDAIPELSTVYFSRLLDSNFRKYVQGWKTNPNRIGDPETYDTERAADPEEWAYVKGHTDSKFDPVEYVKKDSSIALYGVRQGKLDDNDDIFPTIQGVDFPDDNPDIGRVDEVVDVYITSEESQEAVWDIVTALPNLTKYVENYTYSEEYREVLIADSTFVVPSGRTGRIEYAWLEESLDPGTSVSSGLIDTTNSIPRTTNEADPPQLQRMYGISGLSAGTYRLNVLLSVVRRDTRPYIHGIYGLKDISLHCTPKDNLSYRQVFTIWIKNIWQTTQGENESDSDYAHRVWDPILGDKLGKSAAICFSDGFMSTSEDYEFLIQKLPEVDRTKTTTSGVPSEWKITLVRSDAEYEATGLYIPNTQSGGVPIAGDHFFFTGIDIPHQYVLWAEKRLTEYKEAALQDKAWTNPTWVISLDKIKAHSTSNAYAGTLSEKLDAGKLVTITDPRFCLDEYGDQQKITLGIRSVTFTWSEPTDGNPVMVPDIEIVLSDKIEHVSSYDGVKSEITYISRNYATNSSVKKISRTQISVAEGGKIDYLGPVIGTVEI